MIRESCDLYSFVSEAVFHNKKTFLVIKANTAKSSTLHSLRNCYNYTKITQYCQRVTLNKYILQKF